MAVLFKGDEGRMAFFYKMVAEEKIERIQIPGIAQKTMASWSKKYSVPLDIHLPTPSPTGSTFEDALTAAEAIRAHGIHSVLLVTSDYHIPRSWFLLKILTIGRSVAIHPVEVPSRMRQNGFGRRAKMIYNEMVNFWGSMMEMVYYQATGELLFGNRKVIVSIATLKKILLFDVF